MVCFLILLLVFDWFVYCTSYLSVCLWPFWLWFGLHTWFESVFFLMGLPYDIGLWLISVFAIFVWWNKSISSSLSHLCHLCYASSGQTHRRPELGIPFRPFTMLTGRCNEYIQQTKRFNSLPYQHTCYSYPKAQIAALIVWYTDTSLARNPIPMMCPASKVYQTHFIVRWLGSHYACHRAPWSPKNGILTVNIRGRTCLYHGMSRHVRYVHFLSAFMCQLISTRSVSSVFPGALWYVTGP